VAYTDAAGRAVTLTPIEHTTDSNSAAYNPAATVDTVGGLANLNLKVSVARSALVSSPPPPSRRAPAAKSDLVSEG
jgi:hypothetical protein